MFYLITVSSTCFEHPSVHPREDLYMLNPFYYQLTHTMLKNTRVIKTF